MLIGVAAVAAGACVAMSAARQLGGSVDPLLVSMNIGSGEDAMGAMALSPQAAATLADLSIENLRRSPLSVDDIRNAGLAAEALGRLDDARATMTIAGDLSWRDTATQLWLFSDSLRRQRFADAIMRADALMRRGKMVSQVMPLIYLLGGNAPSRAIIVDRLTKNPHWRQRFFDLARSSGADPVAFQAIVADLASTDAPATDQELSNVIKGLIDGQNYEAARDVWLAAHPEARGRVSSSGYMEGFEQVTTDRGPRGPNFGWSLADSPGLSLEPRQGSSSRDVALRIAPLGLEARRIGEALLILDSGTYVLSLEISPAAIGAADLEWEISCQPAKQKIPLDAQAKVPQGEWTRLSWRFALPTENCAAQAISLRMKSNSGGVPILIDNLRVERQAGG